MHGGTTPRLVDLDPVRQRRHTGCARPRNANVTGGSDCGAGDRRRIASGRDGPLPPVDNAALPRTRKASPPAVCCGTFEVSVGTCSTDDTQDIARGIDLYWKPSQCCKRAGTRSARNWRPSSRR
jgi:hypothetical protein